MSHAAQTWAVQQRTGSPARKAVLMNLADRADEAWSCFPGQRRIAEDTELGERTVRRALDDLETAGLVLRFHRRRKDGSWTSDRYVLAGYLTDPDAVRLLADADTSGQSGRRSERPTAGTAAGPAARAARHEPSVTNPHSPLPTGEGGAHAGARGDATGDAPQLALVSAPAKPAKRAPQTTELPEDWEPDAELRAKTLDRYPGVNIDVELERFRYHFRGTGQRWKRWDMCWLKWCSRAAERPAAGRARPGPYRNTGWTDGTAQQSWDQFMAGGDPR